MAKKKVRPALDVYLNGLPLGVLKNESKKNLTFQYEQSWLERAQAFPISRSLPLREEAYEGSQVYAYFDNLLPDGISIRQRVAAKMKAKSDQVFDLLEVVGRDCVGALQFVKPSEKNPLLETAHGFPLEENEIADKLRNLRSVPLAASEEDDFRLSIAGAQEKTAFLRLNNKWQIPGGATPTTHIFKPQIGELKPGLNFSDSVENEWLCAKIASAFGLSVAPCEIQTFENIKVLVVERFDRAWVDNKLIRIPQEDLCQALAIPNFAKYESDGGPGFVAIMNLLNESLDRDTDRNNFFKTQIVFLLLAAIDGHAKNFSLSWRPAGFRMTPLYDILSAQPLTDQGHLQSEKLKMAMAFGENRHYKLHEIFRRHLVQTAKACRFDVKVLDQIIDETLGLIPSVIKKVSKNLPDNFPEEIAESIFQGMVRRKDHFTKS